MEFFKFYLDAWNFCRQNKIDYKTITRIDWWTWAVETNAPKEI